PPGRAVQLHRAPEIIPPHRHRHTLRRYCQPTSKNASLIWPSEQCLTASIRVAKTFCSPAVASLRRRIAAGAVSACLAWKSASRSSWLCFSASVARASSTFAGAARSTPGSVNVFTPTSGRLPSCLRCSYSRHGLLDQVGELVEDERALQRVLVAGQAPFLFDDHLDGERAPHRVRGRGGHRLVVGVSVQAVAVVVDGAQRLQRGADVVEVH